MPYPVPQQDSTGLLTQDQVMALVDSMYRGGGAAQGEYQPLQESGYTQAELYNAEDAKYYPPARDSSGNLMNPGEPNAVPPITPPPSMASPERIRQWETLQAGVRRMSPEEVAAVRAAGAQQENQFAVGQKNAEEAGQDREFTKAFLMTTRVQDAQKAIQAAIRFQAMRQFQRDVTGGMPTTQALLKNQGLYAGDPSAAVRAAQVATEPPWTLKTTTTPGGSEVNTFGRSLRVVPPRAKAVEEGGLSAAEARPIAIKQSQANRLSQAINALWPNDPNRKAMQTQLQTLEDEITEMGAGKAPTRQAIAPPLGVAPAAAAQSVFASSAEARAAGHGSGDKVRIKGVGLVQLR